MQHSADHARPAGSAPTVCGSLTSDAPGAPAEGSASPPVQGQPGGGLAPVSSQSTPGQSGTLHPAGQSSGRGTAWRRGTIGGYRRIFFGLSPDS